MRLSREEFDELVKEALNDVPDEFLGKLENVYVTVEDNPSPEDYRQARVPRRTVIFGLYQGVPAGQRSPFAPFAMPDRITIFQRSIESVSRTREDIIRQIRRTVLHEIAHHFGISDKRLREMGY
jgi:predicted Zn-dependent protease with MMP-like domain